MLHVLNLKQRSHLLQMYQSCKKAPDTLLVAANTTVAACYQKSVLANKQLLKPAGWHGCQPPTLAGLMKAWPPGVSAVLFDEYLEGISASIIASAHSNEILGSGPVMLLCAHALGS
jgi:hypothetical protein